METWLKYHQVFGLQTLTVCRKWPAVTGGDCRIQKKTSHIFTLKYWKTNYPHRNRPKRSFRWFHLLILNQRLTFSSHFQSINVTPPVTDDSPLDWTDGCAAGLNDVSYSATELKSKNIICNFIAESSWLTVRTYFFSSFKNYIAFSPVCLI